MKMNHRMFSLAFATACVAGTIVVASTAIARPMGTQDSVMVGGAAMYPSRTIIQNAVNSKDHTHPGRCRQSGRIGRHVVRSWTVYGLCADQRGLCSTTRGHG